MRSVHFASSATASRSSIPRGASLLMAILACLLLVPAAARADSAEDDYKLAVRHYKASRWKLASEAFETYLKRHKSDARVPLGRFYLGISLENQERYKPAREVFRGFVKDYPQNANRKDALFRVAECSYFLNDLKTAEGEFLVFLKQAPKHDFGEYALPYLGDTQYRLNKAKAAAATFQRALDRFPAGRLAEDAKFGLARCQAALKRPDKALVLYRQLAAQPGSDFAPRAQMEIGLLLYEQKKFAGAAAAFDEFDKRFAKRPERFRARLNAGFAYFENGDLRSAISRFEKATEDKALRPQAEYWRALCHKELKEFARAAALAKAELQRDGKGRFAPELLYEWAACERLQEHHAEARRLYLDFVKRWPKHAAADDALHYAAEMALLAGKPDEAQKLVDRFRREYPHSDLWTYRDLLQARILTVGKDRTKYRTAAGLLQNVIERSGNVRTKSLARFYLARTYRLLDDHQRVLQAAAPLIARIKNHKGDSEYVDVLVLASRSQLAEKRFASAVETASLYLKLQPKGSHTPLVLATRAAAAFQSGSTRFAKTLDADLDRLLKEFGKDPLAGQTVHRLAEAAYQKKDWKSAAKLFARLATLGKESKYHATALAGLGWSQCEAGDYKAASSSFGRLLKDHSDQRVLASQAAFKQAECVGKLQDAAAAAAKYLAAFERFAPSAPAKAGAETKGGADYYVFHAGLSAARTFGKLKKIDEADAAYEKLFAKFPEPADLDKRLYEWALLNYNADRYKRSDEIFRRLVRERPKSDLADDAQYSLAESDLNAGRLESAKKVFTALYAGSRSDKAIKEVSLYRLIGIAVRQEDWKTTRQQASKFQTAFPKSRHRWYAAFSEAEARFHQNDLKQATRILSSLKKLPADSVAGRSAWFPRVWLLLAEAAYRQADYEAVQAAVRDAKVRHAKWTRRYLLDEVLGRSFKRQAKFQEAREAFGRVVNDKHGRRTETAAKCQLLIAETWLMQEDYKSARREYFKVDALYDFPEWQAPALYQAGQCEEKLKEFQGAVKTYEDLIRRFPKSSYAKLAKPRLAAARKQAGLD